MNMSLNLFLEGEYVIKEGTHGDAMFFISKGVMEVSLKDMVKEAPTGKSIQEEL